MTVLQDLWQIGYDAEWHCIPASAVGAPHRRDRIWIIAYPNSQRFSNNQSKISRTDDTQRCEECFEETTASGICSATSGFSENKTRDLADTDSSRQVEQCGSYSETGKTDSGRCNNRIRSRTNEPNFSKKENVSTTVPNTMCEGLAGYSGNIREAGSQRQIIQHGQVSLVRCTRGAELWSAEPAIPRLKDNGLNPDWVEWLMGFPIGWTEGGTRRNRLKSLGNAVVPVIPELIANSIYNIVIDNLKI
ncbi:MAG: DNA cytosine methyltransferase [Rickettsiales bacterium]|nr:DNA cytosine methyltransferase [Rickettsiales bacterium]